MLLVSKHPKRASHGKSKLTKPLYFFNKKIFRSGIIHLKTPNILLHSKDFIAI